jgi:membrane protein DedA with SNARE-associated domain
MLPVLANFDYNAIVESLKTAIDSNSIWPYLILLVWTFFEGETIVIFAGFCAFDSTNPGPNIWLVILSAFCGSLISDQLMFFLGRLKGKTFIAKRPKWQVRAQKVYRILERHQTWLILGFRFLYGLRNITPFTIGMSEVPTRRFILLNVTGAAIWAAAFAWGGFLIGKALEIFFEKEGKWVVIGLVVTVAFVVWVVRHIRRRRARIAGGEEGGIDAALPTPPAGPAEKQA